VGDRVMQMAHGMLHMVADADHMSLPMPVSYSVDQRLCRVHDRPENRVAFQQVVGRSEVCG